VTAVRFILNGRVVALDVAPLRRLADVLRHDLRLTGTKVGCNAGTCGACTVLVDDRALCACLTPMAHVAGRRVVTVEGLGAAGAPAPLQQAFHRQGAVQCGMCTPGMLMAASALLARAPRPAPARIADALGGVFCRCTGYAKITQAVAAAHGADPGGLERPARGGAVGARAPRLDGIAKLTGAERFGDDVATADPDWADALWLRVVRSPHVSAEFVIGDLAPLYQRHPGLVRVLTADDVPGDPLFGIAAAYRDQPVFAFHRVRFRGEAIALLIGDRPTIEAIRADDFPVVWQQLPAVRSVDAALAGDAPRHLEHRASNVLVEGLVRRGDVAAGLAAAAAVVEDSFETGFVEHAYVEPEAGAARLADGTLELFVSTQTPYANRADVARILGIGEDRVRIVPTAVGGGFGGKLDLAVQPYLALACWLTGRPVRLAYGRAESFQATTKRHPARMRVRLAADADGRFTALSFDADFNTGAYASWGPTVATRVPVHASGPYRMPAIEARARAVYTNNPPAGAFRGFGVPQAAIATEAAVDQLAGRLGLDRLEIRRLNALRPGDATATGQVLRASVGIGRCLDALRPGWTAALARAAAHNGGPGADRGRRGVGIAAMWYGCGNTALSNPSTMRVGLAADGAVVLFQGAVDIGQGATTVLAQILADTVGIDLDRIRVVAADTALTADAGKTSASRQTFVSGRATVAAGEALLAVVRRLAGADAAAGVRFAGGEVLVGDDADGGDGDGSRRLVLARLPADADGLVARAEGFHDPETIALDADGQGEPYATYAFGAQMAEVLVDPELATVRVERIVAAHDVGRAINPTLIEGQIEGGIVQGLGMALLEEFLPDHTRTLGDYLVPTIGDIPVIETILIEEAEPAGPFGAKGVGEPALIPTAAAILNAVRHAVGVVPRRVPATPTRLYDLLQPPTAEPETGRGRSP
jgi:CO/xanthine dehydrogenase Mo-binding subunit/aerobic-type carbon monoxide dehydrogenase small subunit (CoxS/CutS family)